MNPPSLETQGVPLTQVREVGASATRAGAPGRQAASLPDFVSRAAVRPLRVAHVARKFDPAEWGGTETALQRLFAGMHAHQAESVMFCPRIKNPAPGPTATGCRVKRFHAFLPIWGISAERRRTWTAVGGNLLSFDLPLALWREPGIRLIHTHTLGRLGGIAATVARARRLPLVATIHGGYLDLPDALKDLFRKASVGFEWGKVFGFLLQSRRVLERADAILTCNPSEARMLREKFPGKRVQVQPHGIPLTLYERDCRGAAHQAFPQIRERQLLLCVGRVDPVKNQGWLVAQAPEIFRRHPRALLVLVGPCTDEEYGNQVQTRVRELGLTEKILLTGGLPPDDTRLIGLFQEAQALLLPSISETFGLVLLEAWAAGTTVICSGTSGARSLVRPGENGWLFDLEKPNTFHVAVDGLLAEPGARAQLVERGKRMAAAHDMDIVAEGIAKLYAELIADSHALRHSARR